jgi:hypothetical protein
VDHVGERVVAKEAVHHLDHVVVENHARHHLQRVRHPLRSPPRLPALRHPIRTLLSPSCWKRMRTRLSWGVVAVSDARFLFTSLISKTCSNEGVSIRKRGIPSSNPSKCVRSPGRKVGRGGKSSQYKTILSNGDVQPNRHAPASPKPNWQRVGKTNSPVVWGVRVLIGV